MAKADGNYPLIPAVDGLTTQVLEALDGKYKPVIAAIKTDLSKHDIETILSRVRSFSQFLGKQTVHGLDGDGYKALGTDICERIGKIVSVKLPPNQSAYAEIVNWITGAARDTAIEIFTTNYDLLFEQALEAVRAPYFDGFSGASAPFFDPVTIARNDLPPRWTRLWKLHGSLGWSGRENGEVVRVGGDTSTHLVFPEHLKYDQTQKAPYAALFDRLRAFLSLPDTLLISTGFSYSDAHVSSRIGEALAGNPSASVFAFQFKPQAEEAAACEIAKRSANFSVYCPDGAKVNGARGRWSLPAELPSKDWGPIRATYWGSPGAGQTERFLLGAIEPFAKFFSASRSLQAYSAPLAAPTPPVAVPGATP
jgi:hypothetical protein